jgi:hypothetical protein
MKPLKLKQRRARPEQAFQIALCRYLDVALPPDAVYFAIPNGFKRTKAEAGIAKAMGQKAGMPDLMVLWKSFAIGIECKAASGSLNKAQRECAADLYDAGIPVFIVRTIEEATAALKQSGVPLKARAA